MNRERRKFLKMLLIGSGAFLVGKVFGPLSSRFLDHPVSNGKDMPKPESKAFRIVEDKKVLSIFDETGEEIFQIDKSA